jgi:hypothetical protein
VCVFCLDEDNFSLCDKCSKVACLTDDFFDSRSCMDLCEGCDKWFCNKCQKDQGFEFCMHCGEKRFQSTDGCLVRMGTFTKPMCASNILLSFSPLTSFFAVRCSAGDEHICQDCKQICQTCDANVCYGCMRDSMDGYCAGRGERYSYVL